MPLYDQDGRQVDQIEVVFQAGILVVRALVQHDMVSLFVEDEDEPALVIDRPKHPGAGLALDSAEWVTVA